MGRANVKVGDIYPTNNYGDCEVLENINNRNVKVRFVKTGYITTTRSINLRNGEVKDKLLPSIYTVGFVGAGQYKPSVKGKDTKEYSLWVSMLSRCYKPKNKRNIRYVSRGVTVCKEWHNFQTFAKWCNGQPNFSKEGFQLDKDLKVLDSKTYSPETCSFVSQRVNLLLVTRNSKRGKYPVGVSYFKRDKNYAAQCNNGTGTPQFLGYHDTPEEAFAAYKLYKENLIKEVAKDEYNKGNICKAVYLNLLAYEVVPYPG